MNPAHRLAAGVSWIDLQFLGRPKRIAAGLLQGAGGAAIVDPGPTSCLPTLERALEEAGVPLRTVSHLLLTHIHLDHAGAAGTIARRHPGIRVVVHQQGAPHLADPAKLLQSATRLYGADMDRLWGACEPVPPPQLQVVDGGEALDVAGRPVSVTYTPGHAKHHVSYFDPTSGVAWVGDVAGVCIPDDRSLWARKWRRARDPWKPAGLPAETMCCLRHPRPTSIFPDGGRASNAWNRCRRTRCSSRTAGRSRRPACTCARLPTTWRWWRRWRGESLAMPGTDDQRKAMFDDRLRRELRRHMDETQAQSYESAAAFGLSWAGLARYLRRIEGRRSRSRGLEPVACSPCLSSRGRAEPSWIW